MAIAMRQCIGQCEVCGIESAVDSVCVWVQAGKNVAVVTMRKKGIHPEWYEEAKVVCNGEEVLTTSGTQPGYNVDIWSGNHPYFQGVTTSVVTDEGRVNKFKRRFAGLDSLSAVETTSSVMEKQKGGQK